MRRVSRFTFALMFALVFVGAAFAYFAFSKQQATFEILPAGPTQSGGELGTVVGDETPFAPQW